MNLNKANNESSNEKPVNTVKETDRTIGAPCLCALKVFRITHWRNQK